MTVPCQLILGVLHMRQISEHNIHGKQVKCIKEGQGPIHCLIIGPGALYLPTIPEDAKKELFTFYDADRYFAYPSSGEVVSKDEIEGLTINDYIQYYESARKALKLDKIALFGPSAIGLVAHEYARQYPEVITHVILLGSPSTTKNLPERQRLFMEGNYNPQIFPMNRTEFSAEKWKRYQVAQQKFIEQKAQGLTADESLIKELVADQEKYSILPESEETLRNRWQRFNTTMRAHFFGTMIKNYEMQGEVTVPTFAILGLFDGIAPCYDLTDKIEHHSIYGKIDYVVLADAAHSPQLESSQFTAAIKKWLITLTDAKDESFENAARFHP